MRVVLIKDVPNLGTIGEIREVRPGFARNFLLQKNMAVLASDPQALAILNVQGVKKEQQKTKKDQTSSKLSQFAAKEIAFTLKVNKKGLPFKAIGPKDIAEKMEIPEEWVKTKPLKKMGKQEVLIQSPDSKVTVSIVLTPEK